MHGGSSQVPWAVNSAEAHREFVAPRNQCPRTFHASDAKTASLADTDGRHYRIFPCHPFPAIIDFMESLRPISCSRPFPFVRKRWSVRRLSRAFQRTRRSTRRCRSLKTIRQLERPSQECCRGSASSPARSWSARRTAAPFPAFVVTYDDPCRAARCRCIGDRP